MVRLKYSKVIGLQRRISKTQISEIGFNLIN